MNTFAILLLCVQACLVQNAYGQCYRAAEVIAPGCGGAYGYGLGAAGYGLGAAGYGLGAAGFAGSSLAGPALVTPLAYDGYEAAYGGEGVGDVSVAGQLPVAGTTLVYGQVPILGAVDFGGIVPACGQVSIAGSCGCGCKGAFY